jgi:hypothetical protein
MVKGKVATALTDPKVGPDRGIVVAVPGQRRLKASRSRSFLFGPPTADD